jgi:hypothetical protein
MLLRSIVFALACLGGCSFAIAQSFQQPGVNVTINGNSSPLSSAVINIGSSGANTVIAGQTGKIIRVYRMAMVPLTSVTATIQDGSTSLTGPMPLGANQELLLGFDTQPYFVGTSGNPFIINLSGAVPVGGMVYFTTN